MALAISYYINHVAKRHSLYKWFCFFPGADRVGVRQFQNTLKNTRGKINAAIGIIKNYGLLEKVELGKIPLLDTLTNLGNLLINLRIYSGFFVEALYVIGCEAKALVPLVNNIDLSKLGKNNIAKALKERKIEKSDIGSDFGIFYRKNNTEKISTLIKLGVIVLKKESTWPPDSTKTKPETPPSPPPKAEPGQLLLRF